MSVLLRQAERIKLERLLDRSGDELAFLDTMPAPALTALREQVLASLFDGHAEMFKRLAESGKLLPVKLSALVAEKALGPRLCGRVAGYTPVERAIALAEKLSVTFMSDVATEMDPRRVQPLLRGISESHIRAVARELASRNDVVAMGRFIDALPVETTERVLEDFRDDGLLLRVAFFADDKAHLSKVVELLPEDRLRRIIAAAHEQGLLREALALMHYVAPGLSRRLGDLAADEGGFFEALVNMIHEQDLWEDGLLMMSDMSVESRRQLLALPRLQDDDVLHAIIETVTRHDLSEQLLAVRDDMPPRGRARLAELAPELSSALAG